MALAHFASHRLTLLGTRTFTALPTNLPCVVGEARGCARARGKRTRDAGQTHRKDRGDGEQKDGARGGGQKEGRGATQRRKARGRGREGGCLRARQQGGAPLTPRRLLHGSKLLLRSSCRRLRGVPGSNIIGGLLAGGVYSDPPYCGVPCEARDICSRAELCRSPQRKAPVFSPNSAEHGDAT